MTRATKEDVNTWLIDLERKGLIKIDHTHDTVMLTEKGLKLGEYLTEHEKELLRDTK